ncbi:beta strand repeat-containing protein [Dehalogenimonas etheniformans]|uniref:Fibronectin type-III domain-containing protein n=1 Tax=Dehalogenimonas etheniformans TaxID=1536648 RepID=A0A2P5P6T6_9CHLR|nr:hypothetical protein [Dehalogenimonas etheniformans]PPD57995.1 hypothetical protein JP09_006815 [Dehalogenimonas etheniformans]QNT75344.1 hypothetical protein HX448_00895 [Dehalogenimonas etheniformans]
MKHLNKIFGIVLTAAIAASMLVVSALPVSAADNAWTEFKVPAMSKLTASGFLTKGIDGALYAYTNTVAAGAKLSKSVDGGRTWTSVTTPGAAALTAIATSPSEANVVYVATAAAVWKSVDGGATFAAQPVGAIAGTTSLAVGLLGGSYKVFAGTNAGVFLFDEGVALNNNFVLFGGTGGNVLDVKLSPTFNTAAGIYALFTTATGVEVRVSTGGAWQTTSAQIAAAAIPTAGEIGFSSDFNLANTPVLFVGFNGANGGVFRTIVAGTSMGGTEIGTLSDVVTIDVTGSGVFGGAVTIVAGTGTGAVSITSNAGVSGLTAAAKNVTGGTPAFVALANDYATSGTVFVLTAATAADFDETGFSISTDKAANFVQVSLLDSTIANIDGTAFAANGDIYLVSTGAAGAPVPGAGDAFTLSSVLGAGDVTVTGAVSIVAGAGATVVGNVITFTAANGIATVTATAAGNVTWTNGTATDTVATETVDANASMTVGASGVAFAVDMNPTTPPGAKSLWRNMGGKWDRLATGAVAFDKISVSPNYATDKGVYYVVGNTIWASSNNGVSFAATTAAPAAISSYVILDTATFVVASGADIYRTTNSGFIWNVVSTADAAMLVRSSDATTLAAVTAAGDVFTSADLGATWKAALSTGVALAGVSAVTFQNGSNTVLWGTTATGGISKLDLAATTVAWTARTGIPAALTNGVGIASGIAATPVVYVLDAAGSLTRLITDASQAENIAAEATVTAASKLSIVPAAGGNTLWAVTATKLFTFKDTIAIIVPNVAVPSFTTSRANVTFDAVPGATDYAVFVSAGSSAQKDYFTATTVGTVVVDKTARTATVTGLTDDTTYTVSVFAKTPFTSIVGSKTFATQPVTPGSGIPQAVFPAPAATGISINPGFQWTPVDNATSYTIEVSTSNTFATLVGTKQTTTVNAFAWTTPALAYNTSYYWRVVAITPTGTSDPVVSVFTTMTAPPPTGTTQPPVTVTNTTVTLTTPTEATPAYIWAIIGIGALLVIVVIVLIVRTRRVA